MPFDVLQFDSAPNTGAVTFATVGLSSYPLQSAQSGRQIKQELLMTCLESQKELNIPAILQQVGAERRRRQQALLRGELIGPRGPLFPGRSLTALYAAIPIYFPDGMHSSVDSKGDETVFVWLLPLHESEAAMVAADGWEAFERKLADQDPDLNDLDRPQIR
jgi:hypothetical protein